MGRSKPKKESSNFAHGCTECGLRYEDRWAPAETNDLCQTCKRGHPRPDIETSQFPKDCCYLNARPATKEERTRMTLGGPATMPWYICAGEGGEGCYRTFPYVMPAEAPWVWENELPHDEQEMERERQRRHRYSRA